ncbi:alkanesulfonate monooxygenase SsuD/methylene tetrahydromethanopterin reductase-like flavin-dependent oxidoreductase (luciferase family) [Actinocorallia herbida]|uniref:Alkanesulfonate monooxygenase SsuD/methylene tetrahydromethanopterin reductase-like flavin-dependent oxidoreductase (Luciferase family) n=1 Tax=Actinocorallia herbida TaxID=58109 RepID=A0A3N1CXL7_9ACTN|nr:LLM class flavin-dependent oxidoreductase [Actinocorallia herbida]ROO86024.1 alkanesulfonate monooxygenase SsuD/methylene tetrahydromethanopterin reductase-like flavin-dependent oxidoreductase (luciferase family) [Actinocorallia herbida]
MTRPLFQDTGFKLGLFAANCSSGMAITKAPSRWSGSWQDNLRMAKVADEVGIDFLLPIARFIGYKGATNFHESVLEPIPWAAGLLSATERISVISTVHSAFNHPLVTAKQMVTLDHISDGRAGLNIVAGWNKPEYDAMGSDLPTGHDDRYEQAQEWYDIIKKTWTTEGSWDHEGRFYHLKGAEGMPKPVDGLLPIINAGSSPQGRGFAARNADFGFTIVDGPEDAARITTDMHELARKDYGRDLGVITISHVVVRETQKEAREFYAWYGDENADWDAVDNLMYLMGAHSQSFTPEMLQMYRKRFAGGHGSVPLIGTPDQIALQIKGLADAGLAGITMAFFDYADELPYFAKTVLPRLAEMGIRRPVAEAAS